MHHLKQTLRIFTFLSSARVIVIATFPDRPFSLPSSRTRPPLVLQSSVPVSRLRPSMHNTASGTHCAPIAIPSTRRALLPRNDALSPLRFLLTLSLSLTHTRRALALQRPPPPKKNTSKQRDRPCNARAELPPHPSPRTHTQTRARALPFLCALACADSTAEISSNA